MRNISRSAEDNGANSAVTCVIEPFDLLGHPVTQQYYVYVIELDPVIRTRRRFTAANPEMSPGGEAFYVGSSARSPDERFDQHKEDYKANSYVRDYGLRLRPELYESYNPIPSRPDALEIEAYLADRLRSRGHGVWQG